MKTLHFSILAAVASLLFTACGETKTDNNQVIKIDNNQSIRTNEEAKAEEEAAQKAEMQQVASDYAAKTCDCKGVKEFLKYSKKMETATEAQRQAAASKMVNIGKVFTACTQPVAQQMQQQYPTRKDVVETFNSEVKKLCTVVSK